MSARSSSNCLRISDGVMSDGTPQRILVVGPGGAGKSTFSIELARRSGLPLIHLDALYWRPQSWGEPSLEEWQLATSSDLSWPNPRRAMDGNYGRHRQAARAVCRSRHHAAPLRPHPHLWCHRRGCGAIVETRPDMGEDCPEHLTFEFIKYIWNHPRPSDEISGASTRPAAR